jgi:hypothetical protein
MWGLLFFGAYYELNIFLDKNGILYVFWDAVNHARCAFKDKD